LPISGSSSTIRIFALAEFPCTAVILACPGSLALERAWHAAPAANVSLY
jgi:hypothetical protein